MLYHLVFPAKYRRAVFDEAVDGVLRDVCLDPKRRYQLKFMEIGTDNDHVHFLAQSVPVYSVTKLVTLIKSITAREVFWYFALSDTPLLAAGLLIFRYFKYKVTGVV